MNGINTSMINVTKRDGSLQEFNLDKVHQVLEWATAGVTSVSQSEIELRANIQLYDKIEAYDNQYAGMDNAIFTFAGNSTPSGVGGSVGWG